MRTQTTAYTCANCGTKQFTENNQAPKACLKCDGCKFLKEKQGRNF